MPIVYDEYVKAPGQEIEYTPEMIRELNKCDKDRLYFIKEHIKIVTGDYGVVKFKDYIFPFQEHLISDFINHRFTVNLCGRQQGKTTVVGAYVLSYACFESHKTIGIVSNKEASAKSFLSRIKYMYEQIPAHLKPGVIRWAEKSVEFDNHCKIMIAATSKDSFRGEPINCITGNAKICFISDCGKIFYTSMEKAASSEYNKINYKKDECIITAKGKKFYTVYKTTNKINNKIYIGFHSTNDLSDGYLGSGKILKSAVEKYGVENFEKEYISIFDNKEDVELLENNKETLSKRCSILTKEGFKTFDGFIKNGKSSDIVNLELSNNEILECTKDHKIGINNDYKKSDDLNINDTLYNDIKILDKYYSYEEVDVYDAINVEDTNSFIANGIDVHNCLVADELGFVDPPWKAEEFWKSNYPTISASNTSKIIIISTPNGLYNLFHRIYQNAKEGKNTFKHNKFDWRAVPTRTKEWAEQEKKNLGKLQFEQEYGCIFGDTYVTIKNKMTGDIKNITIEELYKEICYDW